MTIAVFHIDQPTFHVDNIEGYYNRHVKIMSHVADVDTDDLDEAYLYTNSINSYWGDNTELVTPNGSRHRSTSVGDILVEENTQGEAMKFHVVMPCGFTELTPIIGYR